MTINKGFPRPGPDVPCALNIKDKNLVSGEVTRKFKFDKALLSKRTNPYFCKFEEADKSTNNYYMTPHLLNFDSIPQWEKYVILGYVPKLTCNCERTA